MESVTIHDATLYLGDCREILPMLPKVDAVLADPPYGIRYTRDSARTAGYRLDGSRVFGKDAEPIVGDDKPFEPSHLIGIAKYTILWGASAYSAELPSNYGWLVWDKQIVGKWSAGDCELAWTNFAGSTRIFRHRWQGIQRAGEECPFVGGALVHPTQKPVSLMAWCLEQMPKAQTILDPYMGSGSTGVACGKLGRKFIGIEIEPKYFKIACERIEGAYAQHRLFGASGE